jgi:hypothetical protein
MGWRREMPHQLSMTKREKLKATELWAGAEKASLACVHVIILLQGLRVAEAVLPAVIGDVLLCGKCIVRKK